MIKQNKSLDITNLRINGTTHVNEYKAPDQTTYITAPLVIKGGAYIEKGLRIGNQEQMCNGMLYYDGENFFGHSEKLGTCLLSNHTLFSDLTLPLSIFENMNSPKNNTKKYTISAAQNNLSKTSTQELIGEENENENDKEELVKNIIVDVTMKDIKNFYIIIPQVYQNTNFTLNLVITYQFDDSSFINDASINIINQTNKSLTMSCGNDNRYIYYKTGFNNIIPEKVIGVYNIKRITPQFLLLDSTFYHK
jgi:hypothetical protein